MSISQAPAKQKQPAGVTSADLSGWPLDPRERGDFYHPPRAFTAEVTAWRREVVARIVGLYGVTRRSIALNEVRDAVDEGIACLREVSRVLAAVYRSLPRNKNDARRNGHLLAPMNPTVARTLARIRPYRQLELSLVGLDRRLQSCLDDPVPPTLRESLHANLIAHARAVCRPHVPLCDRCEIRSFCAFFRQREVRRAATSDGPRVVDLFCGAGGLSEGFTRAGFRVVAALDSDPVSIRTYWLNHPDVPDDRIVVRDIRDLRRGELRRIVGRQPVDVLLGAPPCQGFSHAGFRSKRSRTGYRLMIDERNYLWRDMVRAAVELRPRIVVMENVPGMSSARHQHLSFLETARRALEAKGFNSAIWRLNAAAYGVPQDRIRFFLVACRDQKVPPPPSADYQDAHRPDFDVDALPPVTLDEAIFDLPPRAAGSGTAVDVWTPRVDSNDGRTRRYLTKWDLLRQSAIIYNHFVRYHNERDLELYRLLGPGEDSVHAIERHGRGDLMRYRRDVFDDKYHKLRLDRPSKTIVSHLAKDGNAYVHPQQHRSISIREAARLQSFHDGYMFCGSPSHQWVQVGNAVPPILAEALARTLRPLLGGSNR